MNVAALLHDSPSDDLRRRQARQDQDSNTNHNLLNQHRPPHHSPPLDGTPRDQRDRLPLDAPHQTPYRRSPPPTRPPSPPRHPSYAAPPDFPSHPPRDRVPHLPPLIDSYEPRRGNPEGIHDLLGPPPGSNVPVRAHPYVVEYRPLPPKSHPKHRQDASPPSSSSMYIQPLPGRGLRSSPPQSHSAHSYPTPVGPGVPGSMPPPPPGPDRRRELSPMYGTHPSPGQVSSHPHPHHNSHLSPHAYPSERPPRGRGSSTSSAQSGPGGAFDIKSSTASPVMMGLQRPPYDVRDERDIRNLREVRERDRDPGLGRPRGPPSGVLGSGMPSGSSLPSLPPTPIGPGRSQLDSLSHVLPGVGLHHSPLTDKRDRDRDRDRGDRDRGRDLTGVMTRERRDSNTSMHEVHREREDARMMRDQRDRELMEQRERERQYREREREELERDRERERRERDRVERERMERQKEQEQEDAFKKHAHSMMGIDDRDHEWHKRQQQQQQAQAPSPRPNMRVQPQPQPQLPPPGPSSLPQPHQQMQTMHPPPVQSQEQVWSRFVPPQTGPPDERAMQEREMDRRRGGMEDMHGRELEWDVRRERPAHPSKSRTRPKERERVKEAPKEERRSRTTRDKEREKAEQEAREREREFMRDRDLAWQQQEAQQQRMMREREMQEMEAVRAVRAREAQVPLAHFSPPHPQHHPHSATGTPFDGPRSQPHQKSQPGKQGPLGPTPHPVDVPPQYAHEREREFRPSKGSGPIPLSQAGMPQPHPHSIHHQQVQHQPVGPGPHMRQHFAPEIPGPMAYPPRRPSPPPFHPTTNIQSVPAAFMFPRTTSPSSTLVLPIRNLGTFVFPRTPFPFLDFPAAFTETGAPSDPLDIRATIYLPSRFIPLTRPLRPGIWGGALIPAVPPLVGAQRQLCLQFSASHPQYGRPWPDEVREGRRVYTDDSDLFLCALHSGWVSWSAARRARREGRDLRMEVRLTREARYVGGLGSALRAKESGEELVEDLGSEDDGSSLLSSGWGNGHDGAGVEILKAGFVAPGIAHSLGLRNRSQRLLEYAERRLALGCTPRTGRKRRRHGLSFADGESAVQLSADLADEELCSTRIMVFGTDSSWPEIGFKYHPDALKTILFPQSTAAEGRPSKRRKLTSLTNDNAPSSAVLADTNSDDDELMQQQRAVVVETLWESFLISQRGQIPSGENDSEKENATDGSSSRRYVIALLTNAGGTSGRLPRYAKAIHESSRAAKVPSDSGDGKLVSAAASELLRLNGVSLDKPAEDKAGTVFVEPASKADAPNPTDDASETALPAPHDPSHTVERDPEIPFASSKDGDESTTGEENGPIQILHRDLGEENFEFLAEGIHILSNEVVNGMRKGWRLKARQWKWVQVGVTS